MNQTNALPQSSYDPTLRPSNPFVEFNREAIDQSVPRRFEQIAAKYAEQTAVKAGNTVITYDALNRMANCIARALLSRSDDANDPVAVVVENDVVTLAAIIGVLKAGKIYVPVDVSYSLPWINFIFDDTQPKFVLATHRTFEVAQRWQRLDQELIQIDALDAALSEQNPAVDIPPDAFAYVLYTSGSTGRPKGVADIHRNLLHYVMRLTNASHIAASDRMTLVRPPSSSGALMNVFLALLNGTALFPIEMRAIGVGGLAGWLIQEGITIFHCGATVFRHFAQLLTGKEHFPCLRLIRLSSGQVSKFDVELFGRHFPDAILLHVLSSTEANTYRVHFVSGKFSMHEPILPVGFPVEDMDVSILDESGQEVAADEVGEIAIRSAFLFPGYWRNDALTAAVFLPDPEGGIRRLFRTGDLGRLRSDGCLDYLGRKDFRLKIRGHSIQAEEVELALLELPDIERAAVAGRKDLHGDERLVAYLVPRRRPYPSTSDLRQRLSQRLPHYMIPSTFVICEALPLNSNGKVDRQALPAPATVRPVLKDNFISPKTYTEKAVTKIWTSALGVEGIGTSDNFFDLGGDSLLAGKILAGLSKLYPWEISVAELFEAPTIAGLSQLLTAKESSAGQGEDIARMFLEVDGLSRDELRTRIEEERQRRNPT